MQNTATKQQNTATKQSVEALSNKNNITFTETSVVVMECFRSVKHKWKSCSHYQNFHRIQIVCSAH